MIIGLEGFGSVWSTRMGPSRERTAFYNTTGIVLDGRLRHRSRLAPSPKEPVERHSLTASPGHRQVQRER